MGASAFSSSSSSSGTVRSLEIHSRRKRRGGGGESEAAEVPWLLHSHTHAGCGKRQRPPDPHEMLQWKAQGLTRREQQQQPTQYEDVVCQKQQRQSSSLQPANLGSPWIAPKHQHQRERAGGKHRGPGLVWVAKTTAPALRRQQHGLSC